MLGAEPAAVAQVPAADDPAAVAHPRTPHGAISYLVLDGDHVAGSGLSIPEKVAQGLSARAYLYTDRPAYRPGHDVELRGVVREVVDGQYANVPGAIYSLEVYDSRGRKLVNRPVKLSDFGTFHETIALDEGAPVGSYRIRLWQPGKSEFAGAFEVQAYQLEKIDLAFDLPRTVYYRGETIKGSVVARYQYGTPLANRAIALQLPDGRTLQGQTDAAGKYPFELETIGFSEEQALRLVARLPQDNVGVAAAVMLAVRAFRIDLSTSRDVYLDGESFALRATTLDAQGEPTGQALSVAVLKRVERHGQVSEREASREQLATDKKTGKGEVRLKVEDDEGGSYVVRASGTDRFGNPVIAERMLTISGKKDETKLRILTDRTTFKVGESAEVRLVNRGPAGTALLTWEADRILSYKIVPLKEGENVLAWEVDGPQFPNFTLAAARMAPSAFHEARLDVRVERDLRVTVKPRAPTVGPGGEVEVEVSTTDQNGKPVAAELSIALVDRSLLRLFGDRLPPIDRFFYDQSRTSAFATQSSATFRYQPATVPVPEAVVEDAAQQAAQLADAAGRGEAMQASRGPRPLRGRRTAPPGTPAARARHGWHGRHGRGHGRIGRPEPTWPSRTRSHSPTAAAPEPPGTMPATTSARAGRSPNATKDGLLEGRRWPPPERRDSAWPASDGPVAEGRRPEPDRAAPRAAVRRDGLLEPFGRHRQGRQGGRQVPRPGRPLRVPIHRPGRVRPRHPRRPGHGRPGGPEGLLRRPEGARPPLTQGDKPRFSAEVHHRGVVGHAGAEADDLRRRPRAGRAEADRRQGRRRRGGPVRPVRGARRRRGPAHAGRDPGRGEGRDDRRGADPPVGRPGVRLGLGLVHRRHDRVRRPAARPPVRAARDARRDLAHRAADADRAGPGRGRLPDRGPLATSASPSRPTPRPTAPATCWRPARRWPTCNRPGRRARPRPCA